MGQRCQVCIDPEVVAIHEALLSGKPRRAVAREFGLDRNAMDRHWRLHVPAQLRAAAARAEDDKGPLRIESLNGDVLLGLAAEQYERSKDLLDRLETQMSMPGAKVDVRAVVASLREVRQSVESLAKLSFSVSDRPAVPVQSTSLAIDAAIVAALERRNVVVEAEQVFDPSSTRAPDGSLLMLEAGAED